MKTSKPILSLLACSLLLASCAGKVEYVKPNSVKPEANSKLIQRNREAVWNSAVPQLGKQFFVINNLDKSSWLINISYSGSPEKYIDCGRITSYVQNARGERTYNFPAASPMQVFEVMFNGELFNYKRTMALEGRVNLIFEEVAPNQTQVTASTRYVVTRGLVQQRAANGASQSMSDTVAFNSNGSGAFPASASSDIAPTECFSTGKLEQEILSTIR